MNGRADRRSLLDASVGEAIRVEVERGGEPIAVNVGVQDLHDITPTEYLEIGGAVAHELSYQQARNRSVPVGGVYLASSGYMFSRAGISRDVVITEVAGTQVESLNDFEERMASFADGSQVLLRYFRLDSPNSQRVGVVSIDRRWFAMQHCTRDDNLGEWP